MNNRLYHAFDRLALKKQDKTNLIPGLLGFMIGGVKTVEVQDRPGYVYVRLRNNTNELIIAFNDQVSPVYDLPVLVVRDEIDMSRYKIQGRDVGKYENWGSVSSYLPRHGNQHSFDPSSGGGGDIVWVYDRQLMPLALVPSGTAGSGNVTIAHDTIFQRNIWKSVGGTGTANLLTYKPTGSSARLVLVYLDQNGNPQTTLGTFFDASITGTAAIVPYLPYPPQTWDIPLGAVRLVSGTSEILWDNIYDLRAILRDATTTGTSTGTQLTIQDDGVNQTQRDYLNFVGMGFSVYDNGSATVVSGTSSFATDIRVTGSIFIDTQQQTKGVEFWDSPTGAKSRIGKIGAWAETGSYSFFILDSINPSNSEIIFRLISGSSTLGQMEFVHTVVDGNYFDVDLQQFDNVYELMITPTYTQLGRIGRISYGLVVGSKQSETSLVVPPTGTVMLRNATTPAASPAEYTTIFSASGTPSAINQSGNRYAMGRDYGVSGSLTFVPLLSPLTSTSWDGDPFSTTPKTKIDLSAVFGAPPNIKAIAAFVAIRDAASSTTDNWINLGADNVAYNGVAIGSYGLSNDAWFRGQAIVPCNSDGDIYYQILASASGSCDIYLWIWGYWL